jgi:LmbE family N-acetylglucosaminyl deacetylase
MDVHDRCRGARVLVLSPHLDDAVFSCGELLVELRRPIVATLFAGVPPPGLQTTPWDVSSGFGNGVDAMQTRRAEDEKALQMLGAVAEHFDFLDHQYGATPTAAQLTASVESLVGVHRPDVVLVPFGLFHSDHALLQRLQALRDQGVCATPIAERGKARERKHAAVHAYRSQCRAFGEPALVDTDAPEGYWLLERLA